MQNARDAVTVGIAVEVGIKRPARESHQCQQEKKQRRRAFEAAGEFMECVRETFARRPSDFSTAKKQRRSRERKDNSITRQIETVKRRQNPAATDEQSGEQNPGSDDEWHKNLANYLWPPPELAISNAPCKCVPAGRRTCFDESLV